MIRRPSTSSALYSWHRDAIAGRNPPRHDGIPEAGWYRTRLTRGGPYVPVEITVERSIDPLTGDLTAPERLICTVDGIPRDPAMIWTYLNPISRVDFLALSERREAIPAMQATMARVDLTQKAMRP